MPERKRDLHCRAARARSCQSLGLDVAGLDTTVWKPDKRTRAVRTLLVTLFRGLSLDCSRIVVKVSRDRKSLK